jgi:hypothetical protein
MQLLEQRMQGEVLVLRMVWAELLVQIILETVEMAVVQVVLVL